MSTPTDGGGGGSYRCVSSRAQPVQRVCSERVTRCLRAPVPATCCRHVCSNTKPAVVTVSDPVQRFGKPLRGCKLVQPQRLSEVWSNARAKAVNNNGNNKAPKR